jgi:hypothetical protein
MKDAFIVIAKCVLIILVAGFIATLLFIGMFWTQRMLFCSRVAVVSTVQGDIRLGDPRSVWVCNF